MPLLAGLAVLLAVLGASAPGDAGAPSAGECDRPGGDGPSRCLYRAGIPSAGLVAECRTDRDCRVGYYYGGPDSATWLAPPAGLATFPKPAVTWHTPTLAEVRVTCGAACAATYVLDARRRRVAGPRVGVLAVDPQRLVLAAAEGRALVVRQVFSGTVLLRLERPWATGPGPAIAQLHFDPDGRLTVTWRRAGDGAAVTERVSVPPRPR